MKQNDSIVQLQGNEGSFYNGFWHSLERSAFHSLHRIGAYLKLTQYSISMSDIDKYNVIMY